MKTLCVIPARLNSTRLPRKMLSTIRGIPMIQMTYLGAKQCPDVEKVLVATDNEEIAAVIRAVGGEVIMTPENLQTGSDRVAYVAKEYSNFDVIINLQGDEPFIKHQMLSELIKPFSQEKDTQMSTLAYSLKFPEEYIDPNIVKVISDLNGNAIYFSRSPIPYFRQDTGEIPVLHHMGLYAFKRDFLLKFTQLPQSSLEKIELLEQLRAIENGYKIRVCKTLYRTLEINTPDELARAQLYDLGEVEAELSR